MTSRRQPARRPAALLLLLLAPALLVAAACGPEPTEIDRSPVAGMTAENPDPGRITGETITEDPPNRGRVTLSGTEGAADVTCAIAGHGEHQTLTVTFTPRDAVGSRLVAEIHDYHGEGDYDAHLTLEGQGDDGSYRESAGDGTASVTLGTLLATDSATHWVSATVEGSVQGEAGGGEVSASAERCFYFK